MQYDNNIITCDYNKRLSLYLKNGNGDDVPSRAVPTDHTTLAGALAACVASPVSD